MILTIPKLEVEFLKVCLMHCLEDHRSLKMKLLNGLNNIKHFDDMFFKIRIKRIEDLIEIIEKELDAHPNIKEE